MNLVVFVSCREVKEEKEMAGCVEANAYVSVDEEVTIKHLYTVFGSIYL